MRPRTLFLLSLAVSVALLLGYGLHRFTLGVDFTDEGAYLAWPLRTLFGERPFTAEIVTLTRPIEIFLYLPFKLHPAMTLYEFRLLGWAVHLGAFAVFATFLFRLGGAPVLSPLIAAVPFFVCHFFGLASPSYNTLSTDFLLIALSLRGLAATGDSRRPVSLHLAAGLALFVATFAHPALGVVAAVLLGDEFIRHGLAQNVFRRLLSPSNVGALAFLGCWLAFLAWFVGSGLLPVWLERMELARSFTVSALHGQPFRFLAVLTLFPFAHSVLAVGVTVVALLILISLPVLRHADGGRHIGRTDALVPLVGLIALILTFTHAPEFLPVCFAQITLVFLLALCLRANTPGAPARPTLNLLLLASVLGAVLYAVTTYYFTPTRSWVSGVLGLPFAFGTGFVLLLRNRSFRPALVRPLVAGVLALAVVCVARDHYRFIQRDAPPAELTARFHEPKLRRILSTPERVRAIDGLCDWLRPRLVRGAPLLAFDDCPMLYYLLDARPTYGLTWAIRYNQTPATLARLDAELRAVPLPRYAIRALVDLSPADWAAAPRANFDHYPLNETVTTHYDLVHTVFPFEVWRLRPAPAEKTSPDRGPP